MTKPVLFTGSAVAIVTPFKNDAIDFDKLGELIEFQISNGTDAIVICGTTGEVSTLPDEEHIAAVKFTVEKVDKRVPVIAGAGSNDTHHGVKLSQAVEGAGADGILSVTPYYNKTTQKGLYEHYKAIAGSVKIPIIIYNVPTRTSLNINPETLRDLSLFDNIVAIKECNLNQVGDVANLCGEDFTIYSGDDGIVVPMMSLGAKGVISTSANLIPRDFHEMTASYLAGDVETARKIQLRTLNLIKALFIEVNPIPIKAALNLTGMNVGICRLPLVEMSDNNLEVLRQAMIDYGFKI
ncbi:MAG TPA: 4-hydroxy-tetrahydrodipicolinate synthase [Syntrophomonadaceae bacterium]|nr:4-hydroxy-tetrahydrodipicolinate synthase [Syntrophomonadaceae bacterium]HPR93826.1 4-hydroxy-tetrahydrodipicolinate synthase [Syntrophomonadaceae bacterium]